MDDRITARSNVPLVVDLDGTACKVDTLHEAFIQLFSHKPIQGLRSLLIALKDGRAAFKSAIADHVLPDAGTIPMNDAVIAAIKEAKENGRKVYLATAADGRVADVIAESLGGLDGVFASERGVNLKGSEKAKRLVAAFGTGGFDYIGNDAADIPVWRAARNGLVCGAPSHLAEDLKRECPGLIALDERRKMFLPYLLALRPHQWFKNGLIALPTIAAHDFSVNGWITVLIAFVSFSLGASGVYVLNDVIDLPHDRAHSEKRHRPIAAGEIPVSHAALLVCILIVLSLALASTLPVAFGMALIVYIGSSIAYSVYLKRKLMIDVVALAGLYGIRVIAGGAATGIELSHWLFGFCFFIFLSLALVKRMAEMIALPLTVGDNKRKLKGRGYRREDLQTMSALTAASGLVGVLVLALYTNSSDVRDLYHHPEFLWGICVLLVYWLGRIYFLTGRGEMHWDPVVFAATDRNSLLTALLVVAVFLIAF